MPIFSFQRSFYLVYFSALLGDWLQGPYVYKLYAYYGFKESQIAVLYVVSALQCPPVRMSQNVLFSGRIRLLGPVWHLHRAPGRPLGQEEDGCELLRDLHLLLPHQALTQLLVAVHRQDLWRNLSQSP